MKRALISVSNKIGIVEFAKELANLGYEIISTGGTKKILEKNNIDAIGVNEVTGFNEILDGRVKTLHPKIHGALLNIRDNKSHQSQIEANDINNIDIVVVNLYPFKETISKENVEYEDAIENIDIGGPTMLRSAAKNHKFVTVICDNNDYDNVLSELKSHGDTTLETRTKLAAKVFRHTASYDSYISNYLTKECNEENPESITLTYELSDSLRYGENPHQSATFYKSVESKYALAYSNILQGKQLSYNNIQDANAALQILKEFEDPCVVALKHMNPCGVGIGKDIYNAWIKAYNSDKTSIFGGIVALNNEVTEQVAEEMSKIFLEIIIAPSFSDNALKILSKKKNLRLITLPDSNKISTSNQVTSVEGGILVQDYDNVSVNESHINCVTKLKPTKEEIKEMIFAYKTVKHVKSNAIVVASDYQTVGVGAGQMNRIGAAELALQSAKSKGYTSNLILASDAFFPFDDVVRLSKEYGVTCIIQPGGSIKDADSIAACDEFGIKMVFTGFRHFKH